MTRFVKSIALIAILVIAGGCWDHLPVERIAFVSMIGVDVDPKGSSDEIISYVIARPSAISSGTAGGSGGQSGGTPFYLASSKEPGFQSSFSTVSQFTPRTLRYTHTNAIVVGEARARQGIDDVLSWIIRNPFVRNTIELVVSTGYAQVVLDSRPILEPLPGNTMADLIEMVDLAGVSQSAPLYKFARLILNPRYDAVAPLIERVDPILASAPPTFEQQPVVDSSSTLVNEVRVIGIAVFKDHKMVGTLTGPLARGAAWVFGSLRASYSIPSPRQEDDSLGFLTLSSSGKVTPAITDNRLQITIDVQVKGEILETALFVPKAAESSLPEIERLFEEAIAQEIQNTMNELRHELGADIFGVADKIYRQSPNTWKAIEPFWDELYSSSDVNVTVKVKLIGSRFAR